MKRFALATILAAVCAHAGAAVLNFDDLGSASSVPTNYGGLTWGFNWVTYSDADYSSYGNTYGSPSGEIAVFNSGGVTQVGLNSGADFNFNGAYFTGWAGNNSVVGYTATSLTISGYNNGSLIGQLTTTLSANQYDWVTANLNGIDELRFTQNNGNAHWWLMDNFTFNESSQVPEPASLALLGIALAGVGVVRRKR